MLSPQCEADVLILSPTKGGLATPDSFGLYFTNAAYNFFSVKDLRLDVGAHCREQNIKQ